MKALVINGHIRWEGMNEGNLNQTISTETIKTLAEKGYEVTSTVVSEGYNIEEEIEKWTTADLIIVHFPINWFSYPYKTKEYIDTVISGGFGKLYAHDGRNNGGDYATGGLLKSKGMVVITWNAPEEVFHKEGQVFSGIGLEDFAKTFTATFSFIGVNPLPTFSFYDVSKNPTIADDLVSYKEHLVKYA